MHCVAHLGLPRGGALFDVLAQFPGVAVFFVISGFLVSDSYLRSRNVASFFFKRGLRIYPALLVNIATIELLYRASGGVAADAYSYSKYLPVYMVTASDYIGWIASGKVEI